jgi:hypothetical protein
MARQPFEPHIPLLPNQLTIGRLPANLKPYKFLSPRGLRG